MRTALVSFMFIFGSVSFASAQEDGAQTDVIVFGIGSVEGDDRVAETITNTLRNVFASRSGWSIAERAPGVPRAVTLMQMELANDCVDSVDRACLGRISESLVAEDSGLDVIVFGRMRRRGEGADEVTLDLLLYELSERRVTHRLRLDATISDLIIRGSVGTIASDWVDRLLSGEQQFEDTGQPYFDPVVDPPPVNPHDALEIAGWSLVGLAVASAVAAVASGALQLGVNGDEGYNAYRSSWDASLVPDVCQVASSDMTPEGRHAASVCNDASLYEILVPVFWTMAAAAGVAGALLTWHPWTASAESPTVSLAPAVGPTFAGLDLSGTF